MLLFMHASTQGQLTQPTLHKLPCKAADKELLPPRVFCSQTMHPDEFRCFYQFVFFMCREQGKRNVQVRSCTGLV